MFHIFDAVFFFFFISFQRTHDATSLKYKGVWRRVSRLSDATNFVKIDAIRR